MSPIGPGDRELNRSTKGLASRGIAGAMWTSVGAIAEVVLHGIVFVILARLLDPIDFGIYALGAAIVGFSRFLGEVGLGAALVQRALLDNEHVRTAFTISLSLGVLVTVAMFSLSPQLASLMGNDLLTPVFKALALLFVIRSTGLVALALLQRELRFPDIARIDLISYVIGYGFVGVALAFAGVGYWALIAAALVQALVQNVQLLIVRRHVKRLGISREALHSLLPYGMGASMGRIGNYLALKSDYLIVGRFLGVGPLGIYSRAYELMAIPVALHKNIINKAFFSAISRVQDDPNRLARAQRRAITVTAVLLFPSGIACAVLAPELIEVALGAKWMAVVVPFQIMALGMFFRSGYNLSVAIARGTGDVLRLAARQWVYAALVVGGAWVGHYYGVTGVAIGVFVALVAHFAILSHLSIQSSTLSWGEYARAYIPAITFGMIVLVVVAASARALRNLESPPILTLLLSGTLTLMVSAVVIRRFPKAIGLDVRWAMEIVRSSFPKI